MNLYQISNIRVLDTFFESNYELTILQDNPIKIQYYIGYIIGNWIYGFRTTLFYFWIGYVEFCLTELKVWTFATSFVYWNPKKLILPWIHSTKNLYYSIVATSMSTRNIQLLICAISVIRNWQYQLFYWLSSEIFLIGIISIKPYNIWRFEKEFSNVQ